MNRKNAHPRNRPEPHFFPNPSLYKRRPSANRGSAEASPSRSPVPLAAAAAALAVSLVQPEPTPTKNP